jgi:hypothetical protein
MRVWPWLLLAAVLGTAQTESKPAERSSSSASDKNTVVKLPVNAVRIAEGVYRFTDTEGKVWLFRRTPFGYARSEEGAVKPAAAAVRTEERNGTPFSGAVAGTDKKGAAESVAPVNITATEEGDNIRFERPTPFGKTQWVKAKSELTAEESRIWEAQRPKAPAESENK